MVIQDPHARRPVQIVGVAGDDRDLNGLFVLASDGTIWKYNEHKDLFYWQQLEPLPEQEADDGN